MLNHYLCTILDKIKTDMGSTHHTAALKMLTVTCNHKGLVTVWLQQICDLHPEKHTPKGKKTQNKISTNFSSYLLHCNSDSEFSKKLLLILRN